MDLSSSMGTSPGVYVGVAFGVAAVLVAVLVALLWVWIFQRRKKVAVGKRYILSLAEHL